MHDSIEVDAHPDEIEFILYAMEMACANVKDEYVKRFNYEIKMPIEWETKIGDNWLQMEEIK